MFSQVCLFIRSVLSLSVKSLRVSCGVVSVGVLQVFLKVNMNWHTSLPVVYLSGSFTQSQYLPSDFRPELTHHNRLPRAVCLFSLARTSRHHCGFWSSLFTPISVLICSLHSFLKLFRKYSFFDLNARLYRTYWHVWNNCSDYGGNDTYVSHCQNKMTDSSIHSCPRLCKWLSEHTNEEKGLFIEVNVFSCSVYKVIRCQCSEAVKEHLLLSVCGWFISSSGRFVNSTQSPPNHS